jgi:hypothetical protein
MADFKIPEGEKFFAFMVWVALAGAALILAIDYMMKRQLLDLAKELREGGLNGQGSTPRFAGPIDPAGSQPNRNVSTVPMANAARLETGNATEHVPFPVRTVDRRREANGRFAAKEIDDAGRDGDTEIPGGNSGVES